MGINLSEFESYGTNHTNGTTLLFILCIYIILFYLLFDFITLSICNKADMGDYKVHVIDCDYDYLRLS